MYDPNLGRFTQTDPILGRRAFAHYSYAGNNPISRIDPWGLEDEAEIVRKSRARIQARIESGDIVDPVEQLPKASDLPTPDFDRFKAAADSLEEGQWKYSVPPMRLEPQIRRNAIKQLRAGSQEGYKRLMGYGAGHAGFAAEAGSVIAGAGPSVNALTENVAAIVRAGPSGSSSTDAFAQALEVASLPGDEALPRPTWRNTEVTSEKMFGEFGFRPQVTFKGGEEVPYGTPGSVRPDFYSRDFKLSLDSKNYDLADPQGRADLMQNLLKQTQQRKANLPADTRQGVILDTRGQSVESKYLERLMKRIEGRAGIDQDNIIILTDEKK
jgi:hypothetical protein